MKDKRLITFVRCVSESKVISTPPPLLKGGEGVRGRDGTLGFKPQRSKVGMLCNSPASLAEGIKEVRSPGRTKERKGAGWYLQQDV